MTYKVSLICCLYYIICCIQTHRTKSKVRRLRDNFCVALKNSWTESYSNTAATWSIGKEIWAENKIHTKQLLALVMERRNRVVEASLNDGTFNVTHFLRFGGRRIFDCGIDITIVAWKHEEVTTFYSWAFWQIDQIVWVNHYGQWNDSYWSPTSQSQRYRLWHKPESNRYHFGAIEVQGR